MEEADPGGEDLVEPPRTEVDVLERADEELHRALGDVARVPAARRVDHLRGAVDGSDNAAVEALADEADRDAVAASDLQDAVLRLDVEPLDDPSESIAHRSIMRNAHARPLGRRVRDTHLARNRHRHVTESPLA